MITNNRQTLWHYLQQQLTYVPNDVKSCPICYYQRSFHGQQFALLILEYSENQVQLLLRNWVKQDNVDKFALGIYKLNQLCIEKKQKMLSDSQWLNLQQLMEHVITSTTSYQTDQQAIILDGTDYSLRLLDHSWQWKVTDSPPFMPLINYLTHLAQQSD